MINKTYRKSIFILTTISLFIGFLPQLAYAQTSMFVNANFYVENSGSMFGYAQNNSDFISVVSRIAADCDNKYNQQVNYYFVNGSTTQIGTGLANFLLHFNTDGMNVGNPATSDLNSIFQQVLANADSSSISILVSDGIYSVNASSPGELIGRLQAASLVTENTFIRRLQQQNFTVYLVKFSSNFNGNYYPAGGGIISINQQRPFYIWIIGTETNINHVFHDGYFSNQTGFDEIAKFVILPKSAFPVQICTHNKIGRYRFRNPTQLNLTRVRPRSQDNLFSFSIAVDFSGVPVSSTYFNDLTIYNNNLGYNITEVTSPDSIPAMAQVGLGGNSYTHIITLQKAGPPWGTLNLDVLNQTPQWIQNTNTNNDTNIIGDTTHTFGFQHLIDGISNAYIKINQTNSIANFQIQIKQ